MNPSDLDHFGAVWNRLTGQNLKHRGVINPRERAWYEFDKAGFTEKDLTDVVEWLKRQIREDKRRPGCLRFSTLIEDTFHFEEELNLMRAERRNMRPVPTARERVIELQRPTAVATVPCEQTAKPVSFWIEQMRKAAQ